MAGFKAVQSAKIQLESTMKTKTIAPLALETLAKAIEAKRASDAVAASAKKTLDAIKESLALGHADYVLKDGQGNEILATFNVRNVRAIDARTDYFHSFKPVTKAS